MTEKKHTPGPWFSRRIGGQGFPGQIGWAIDFNEDQEQVVDFVYEEADAKLIAAAPDLLDAAIEALAVINRIKPAGNGNGTQVRLAKAIAKATQ
ncbi:hypothetical protein C4C32_18145 [Pseudomonas corrugata]|uniref:Uncharacterized protein n=1 Tax=Pseudomonas corrugata TaxID=47879 RepID=A0A8B6UZ29_9PSED|nr:hypothetical protein [Pseudomonas corrugata]QTH17156.1 hypothetical protein C4C32_18145 [Pseudomonas corrugata]